MRTNFGNVVNDLFLRTCWLYDPEKGDLKQHLKYGSYESFFVFDNEYYRQMALPWYTCWNSQLLCFFMSIQKQITLRIVSWILDLRFINDLLTFLLDLLLTHNLKVLLTIWFTLFYVQLIYGSLLNCALCAPSCLRTLPIIDTRLTHH